eukprot:CAMPEP_0195037522 /NCGR_PEP_ID=MMETSP0326_2-20130528/75206_1 /TAXON_ID=2866 ORGANISM="Crypthecodinium cohnii, Strain Seligo" /NCGR_SAMPLE_ID=MMETSP0326_2 /ASSEMBLY_ACC=CAM_ASM_000348 /LENGTH=194 /DNA_ID=CAMNT_0040063547 /DNA_START=77 /DNA_END=659 /DNA_ORIENTATION=+
MSMTMSRPSGEGREEIPRELSNELCWAFSNTLYTPPEQQHRNNEKNNVTARAQQEEEKAAATTTRADQQREGKARLGQGELGSKEIQMNSRGACFRQGWSHRLQPLAGTAEVKLAVCDKGLNPGHQVIRTQATILGGGVEARVDATFLEILDERNRGFVFADQEGLADVALVAVQKHLHRCDADACPDEHGRLL